MIEYIDDNAAISRDERAAFTFEVIDKRRETNQPWTPMSIWDGRGFVSRYGDWNIFPYGEGNRLPQLIRDVVYSNSIAPGILGRKTGLNWGKGPKLYEEKFDEDGVLFRQYKEDAEIQQWLDSWDYENYLLRCVTDFSHMDGCFTKVVLNKGWRIGTNKKIHSLEHLNPLHAMMAGKKQTPTHFLIHDRDNPEIVYELPMFDKQNPFRHGLSVLYSNLYSFATDHYAIPQILGSIPWIIQSTNVPKFLAALSRNSVNIKYHITSPADFWKQKREELIRIAQEEGKPYRENTFKRLRTKILMQVQEVLSGIENAGKFWHSERVLVVNGQNYTEMGWKIEVIDQKMKDTVDAQIAIANKADASTSTGIGLQSSLANISKDGAPNSGSEQYYGLNTYLQTGIDIPEMICMQAINAAIRANFPEKRLRMGLYHIEPKRQEDVTQADRNKIA